MHRVPCFEWLGIISSTVSGATGVRGTGIAVNIMKIAYDDLKGVVMVSMVE